MRHQRKKKKIPAGRQEESDKVPDAIDPDNEELPLQNNVHAGGEEIVNNNIIYCVIIILMLITILLHVYNIC